MPLIRLAYASEATFEAKTLERGIEPHVARILLVSRRNNAKVSIVGGLYYSDNRFFQYLEGEEGAVRATYQRIQQDPRHRNMRILIEEPVAERTFTNWSMKYVPSSADVQAFLDRHKLAEFNPVAFDSEQCEEMIDLIRCSSQDQKSVNYDEANRKTSATPQALSSGLKAGLIAAVICLVVALVVVATML
ncbi:MAG: BLUF domain-containing protein [Marinobacter sp.]